MKKNKLYGSALLILCIIVCAYKCLLNSIKIVKDIETLVLSVLYSSSKTDFFDFDKIVR